MDQPPPSVAFTVFTDVRPSATETEIGTALCAIGRGRTLNFFDLLEGTLAGQQQEIEGVDFILVACLPQSSNWSSIIV